jgi:hypothetical protein
MNHPAPIPTCFICGKIVWPHEPAEVSIWLEGDPDLENALDPNLSRGGIVHGGECADKARALYGSQSAAN